MPYYSSWVKKALKTGILCYLNADKRFCILPPYPCQGCIDTQVKLLTDNLPDCVYEEIAVITPEIRSRDMKTAFSSLNNVDYYQYQESDYVVESPLISATGIILSRMDSGRNQRYAT